MLLNREQVLQADDLKYEDIDVPEWGEGAQVRVRRLSGSERDAFEASLTSGVGKDTKMNLANLRARLVAKSAIGEDGRRLFTDDDVRALGRKSSAPLDRLFEACQKLSGLSNEDVERLAENFGETGGDEDSSD